LRFRLRDSPASGRLNTVHHESDVYEALSGASAGGAPQPLAAGAPARLRALLARSGVSPAMLKGAIWSMGGYASGAVASFVVQVILARALQATRYGVYSYLLAWANVAVLVGKLEFDTVAIRFIATYDGQRQDGLLRGFWQYGWRVVSRTTTLIALLAGAAAWLLRQQLHPGIEGGIWAACVLVPLTALLAFSGCTLQGLRRVPQSQLPQLVLRPVLFGAGIVLVGSGLGMRLGAGGAVALNAVATAVALAVSLVLLRRAAPASAIVAPPVFDAATWMRTVRGYILISAAQLVLSQQADILVVGTVLSSRDAGLYSVASQLTSLVGLGAAAVIFVALPAVTDLYARRKHAEFQHLVVRTVQACAAVSVPVVVLLLVAGRVVLRIYGAEFTEAYPILLLLSIAGLAGWTIGIPGSLLPATGHEWQASRVIVATALLNLALTFVLTPKFGVVGAATATLVAQLTRVGVLRWYAWRYLGVTTLFWLPAEQRIREDV
jgi:O-antigen/teichoic acid export membrane protein